MRMKLDRRGFLQLLAPPLLVPGTVFRAGAQTADDAMFLLVDGIGPTTPADQLAAFVDPFLSGEIPIGLVLRAPLRSADSISSAGLRELRRILAASADMVEPVLSLPRFAERPPYFQRRAASDSIRWLSSLTESSVDGPAPPPVSVATDASDIANLDALRCLGIRSILSLDMPPPVLSTGCANLAVCLYGATTIPVAETADPAHQIDIAFDGPGWVQIVFSLAGLDRITLAEARLRGQRAIDGSSRELERGRRFIALPRDHALWSGDDQPRFVALRVEEATDPSSSARSSFLARLGTLGIPYSDTITPGTNESAPWPGGACLNLAQAAQSQTGTMPFGDDGPRCASASSAAEMGPIGVEAALDLLVVPGQHAAFNDRGLLVRGETPAVQAAILLEDSHRMRDAILAIGPDDYETPAAFEATLATLGRLQASASTRLVDLPAFLQQTVTPDTVLDLLRGSRRDPVEQADPDPLSTEEWRADAVQAWSFFQRFSFPSTGLCVDTAQVQGNDEWLHRELTMWDVGSLIAAVMAAQELGLMSDADFIDRAHQIVQALPTERIGGRMLPSEVIAAETGSTLSDNFNACDTGRLLSVLRELDAHPLTQGIAAEKTRQWDLESAVVGGRVHSVVDGALVDRFRSHCAHYTARAFRDWGVAASSPYEVPEVGSQTDREMLLLHMQEGMGPLGAEPLLLEALEMGMSGPSTLLASVLYSAQRREFERTNVLHCVSEAPLNRPPWFTYQGLNVTSADERWMVSAASDDTRFSTPAFRRETALVNTKAAYLWAAYRPGPYSTLLARHVRTRARLDNMGFAPGVFAATGEGMPGYADVNTNGIVLQAIAFILRGRRPRLG